MSFVPSYDVPAGRRGYRLAAVYNGRSAGLLLLHGFMVTPGSARPMAERLHKQFGLLTHAPLLSGHGELPNKLHKVTHANWLAEAEAACREMSKSVEQIFIVGHSMGAVLAAHLALQVPSVAGLILFAPVYHLPDRRLRWLRTLSPLLPWLSPYRIKKLRPLIRERVLDFDPTVDFDDPNNQAWLREVTRLPTSGLVAMVNLVEYGQPIWARIRLPVVLFQGKRDRAIKPAQQRVVFEQIGSTNKTFHHLDGGHELMRPIDLVHEQVWQETAVFLQKHLSFTRK